MAFSELRSARVSELSSAVDAASAVALTLTSTASGSSPVSSGELSPTLPSATLLSPGAFSLLEGAVSSALSASGVSDGGGGVIRFQACS